MTADFCYIIIDNDPPECVTDISPIMIYSLCAGLCLYIGQVCSSTHTFMDKQSYGLTQEHEVRNSSYWAITIKALKYFCKNYGNPIFFLIWNYHKCLGQLFLLHLNSYVMLSVAIEIF